MPPEIKTEHWIRTFWEDGDIKKYVIVGAVPEGLSLAITAKLTSLFTTDREYLRDAVGKIIVHTPDEVATLNKYLPSTIQEQAYHESVGFVKAITAVQKLLEP